MMKSGHLDELQLLKRGNVFKHGLFSLMGLLLVNALLYACGIEWAPDKWPELTIILFVVVLCSIEFIFCDIYPLTEKRQKYLINLCGLYSVVALIACGYDLAIEKAGIVRDGKITESALGIVYSLLFAAIFFAYKIKARQNAKHEHIE